MMGLEKAIESGKDHRKPYRRAKAVDSTCRNHGSCPWCKDDRTHSTKKRLLAADDQMEERRIDG